MKTKLLFPTATIILLTGIFLAMPTGINDAGNRTVVQYPSGRLLVKFTLGTNTVATGSNAIALIDMLSVKTAKYLALGMTLPSSTTHKR